MGNLKKLSTVDMSNNLLSGKIPFQLGNLEKVQYFNLSYNNLFGIVPHSILYNYISKTIDLSYNQFEDQSRGSLEPLEYNSSCSKIKGLSRCKKRHQIILIFVVSLSATLLLLAIVLGFLFHKQRISKN